MVNAFNAIAECFFTGLVTAGCIYLLGRFGLLPMMVITYKVVDEDEEEE